MVRRFLIALVLVVLICGGLVGFNLFRSAMISYFFANMQTPAVTVSATEVAPTTWTPEIEAIGTLRAAQGVEVSVEAAGTVDSISFAANDNVEQGQILVQIDDAIERAEISSAEAAVERDRAQLERAQSLRQSGVSSEATLDEAQTAFAESESTLARLRAVLDQKAIEAPFSGTIGIPRIDVGQYVQPGTMVATLQQLDVMRVDFTVPEQQMDLLELGQAATFGLTPSEFPYEGHIIGIDPKIDPEMRMISVRAEVENPSGELRPGQFVRVRLQLPPVEDVIAVPQTALITSLYGDYVYVVEEAAAVDAATEETAAAADEQDSAEGVEETAPQAEAEAPATDATAAPEPSLVAKQVFVEIGQRQGNMVEILKGIEPGQTIVTSGQNKLANNAPVTINNTIDPAEVALGDGDADS
jgi:membrane fusion protein (multidrug efflux system)